MRTIIVFIFFSFGLQVSAADLKEFKTDNCTMFVDGTVKNPNAWKHCCVDHDLRYWFGGSKAERSLTDKRLRKCVRNTGHKYYAKLMYRSVRIGRHSPVKNKYKWGWGWTSKFDYRALTKEEVSIVNEKLNGMSLDPDYLDEFKVFHNLVE